MNRREEECRMLGDVSVERRDRLMVISLNRPERRNAMTLDMSISIAAALDDLDADDGLDMGVLTGSGGYFCAGMDLRDFAEGRLAEIPGRGFGGLTEAPPKKLLIGAVEGFALAGGCELVMACDLVIAGQSAQFGVPEVARGLVPAQGGLNRLARLVPPRVALELVVTGRHFTAAEALGWGFVNHVVADGLALEAAIELAEAIGVNSPLAVRTAKSVMLRTNEQALEETWPVLADALAGMLSSGDPEEGALAFLDKRSPVWPSRAR